jgi:type VII secretion protein EccE
MTSMAEAPDTTSGTVRHRSFRWLLPIAARQVVVWQLAALAVLITAFPVDGTAIAVIAVAVLAVAATTVRVGGLCGYQWLAIAARFLVRRRPGEAVATPLLALEPKLTIGTHVGRGGDRIGVTSVGDGHSVTIRLAPGTNPDPAALLSLLRNTFDRTDVPLAAASLVSWSTPGRPVTPAPVTLYWLALHYRQHDAPAAALARGGGADGARRAATAAALRLVTDLAAAGYDSSVLDPQELHDDLITATGTGHDARYVAASTVGYRARESWDSCVLGTHRQVCLVPLETDDVVPLFGRCPQATTFTSTAYTLRRSAWGATTATAAVRVGLPNYRNRLTAEQRTQLGRLLRADGRHRRTTLATLPLALV